MSRCLVIGGAGFIGGHLAKALAQSGHSVDVLDNFSRGVADDFLGELARTHGVGVLSGDLVDPQALAPLDDRYDYIFQLAAIIGVKHVLARPYEVLHKNVAIHASAIAFAQRQRQLKRFVFASTSEVYAGSLQHLDLPVPTPETVPLVLTDLAQPRTSYMLSKLYGEAMCQQSGVPFTILRPHNVYGERMGLSHVVPELMQKARAIGTGGSLPVASVSHRRAFCHVSDAIDLTIGLAMSDQGRNGTFNIGNGDAEISMGELARLILKTIGREDIRIETLPDTPGSPHRRCPDMTHAIAASGVRPRVSLEEGLRLTHAWYETHVFSRAGLSAQ